MGGAAPNTLTSTQTDAIGYLGGGILAICLIPQVAKVVVTRSARDISISWSVLYSIGLTLSLAYLILMGAIAAWIPIIFEIAGCLIVLGLKLWYENTAAGRAFSAAKQQQQRELPLDDSLLWQPPQQQQQQGGQAADLQLDRSVWGLGAAAAACHNGDISWRGRAVLGQNQEAPNGLVIPMLDCSVRNGSRHGSRNSSMHGGMNGSKHGVNVHGGINGSLHGHDTTNIHSSQHGVSAVGKQQKESTQQQQQQRGSVLNKAGSVPSANDAQNDTTLEVRCIGTSSGSASSTSISAAAAAAAAAVTQPMPAPAAAEAVHSQQQQQQQQRGSLEPLFASTWCHKAVEPMHMPKAEGK